MTGRSEAINIHGVISSAGLQEKLFNRDIKLERGQVIISREEKNGPGTLRNSREALVTFRRALWM